MKHLPLAALLAAILISAANPQNPSAPKAPAAAPPKAPAKSAATKNTLPADAPMTNRDVIRLVQAKISEDVIIAKIRQSKTRFDTSVDGILALKAAGATDSLIAVMMNPGSTSTPPPPPPPRAPATAATPPRPAFPPAETAPKDVVPRVAGSIPGPRPASISQAPENFGVYVEAGGQLKPLGRIQTKVQISKFRSLVKSVVPFVREKVDINIPGAHSTSRFETLRPTFYAFFPASRDVSKFKLLQAKITGQKLDQRTLANASVLFSTEQNQDEILCDIGPTGIKDLYRIFPKEDIPTGEFGFVEGNTGSKSTSNIEILDVYDFGIDRKEEKLPLKEYLDILPAVTYADNSFLEWTKEQAEAIVVPREGRSGVTGSLLGWFKRQYASLDVYWADAQFARAFARLEMLDRDLSPDQARKLCSLLLSPDNQYYIVVSIGGKVGSGRLIGANEGERLMRPFDASLTNEKGKDVVPAKRMEFIGGYAGLWKVTFDKASIRGPLTNETEGELTLEARLNQNLDFKSKFDMGRISAPQPGGPPAKP
jgi:hypothetical protein